MKDFEVRIYALPCDGRGRPCGRPRNPRVKRWQATSDDAVRTLIKADLQREGRRVVTINTTRVATDSKPGQLVAYFEQRTVKQ